MSQALVQTSGEARPFFTLKTARPRRYVMEESILGAAFRHGAPSVLIDDH